MTTSLRSFQTRGKSSNAMLVRSPCQIQSKLSLQCIITGTCHGVLKDNTITQRAQHASHHHTCALLAAAIKGTNNSFALKHRDKHKNDVNCALSSFVCAQLSTLISCTLHVPAQLSIETMAFLLLLHCLQFVSAQHYITHTRYEQRTQTDRHTFQSTIMHYNESLIIQRLVCLQN
jgi:hypothetical protein